MAVASSAQQSKYHNHTHIQLGLYEKRELWFVEYVSRFSDFVRDQLFIFLLC